MAWNRHQSRCLWLLRGTTEKISNSPKSSEGNKSRGSNLGKLHKTTTTSDLFERCTWRSRQPRRRSNKKVADTQDSGKVQTGFGHYASMRISFDHPSLSLLLLSSLYFLYLLSIWMTNIAQVLWAARLNLWIRTNLCSKRLMNHVVDLVVVNQSYFNALVMVIVAWCLLEASILLVIWGIYILE